MNGQKLRSTGIFCPLLRGRHKAGAEDALFLEMHAL